MSFDVTPDLNELESEKPIVSVGRVVKRIHEARPDLSPQQVIDLIREATEQGKLNEEKALKLVQNL